MHIETSDAWIRARDCYVEDLNEKEQQMYFRASPESLLDDASTAEKNHGANSTTRRVMDKLQPFVAAIVQYGDAIDVYSNTYSLALGPIWGSIKVLLHIAGEFGKYFDKLIEMFARIGDVIPRFRTYERLFSNHERLVDALSMAYLDIITFCTNAKAVFRRGQRASKATLKMTFKLLWKPFDQQFGQLLNDFRQHQKSVEKEAGLAHMIESADARAVVLADQKQLEKRRREDNRLRIFAMLQAVNYEAKHRKLQKLRLAGTGDWLFQHATYVEWKSSGSSAFLCCRGIPGCGKSILASNLVDRLSSSASTPAASTFDIIYYYCDYADQRTLHLDRVLGSLLNQLFLNYQIPEHIETRLLQAYAGGTGSPAENTLSDIFYSVVALRPELHVVFDGLDECEKPVWKAMLQILERSGAIGQCNVKVFITCVEEGSVAHQLASHACVQLSPAATIKDIGSYVTSSVRSKIEGGDLKIRNPKLEQDIITELLSRANGMFLWVFFQLNDLCESSSDVMIRETLDNLPDGLGETYRRILISISRSPLKARLARKVLQWATIAKRPLHVEELKEAVAFGPDDKSWGEDKIPHEDLMFESCRGLIIKDQDDGTVHFAHHTVRQYLTGGLSTKVDPVFEVAIWDAESLAGRTCVAYLSFSDFETQLASAAPMATLKQEAILESGGPLWIPSVLGIRKPMVNIPYRLLRGNSAVQPSESGYWKLLIPQPKPRYTPSTVLKDKYRLLCYAIAHWEPHTRLLSLSKEALFVHRLENLAKHKTLAFDFRPWGSNEHFGPYGCVGCPNPSFEKLAAKDLPHISMIHYAAKTGNLLLLTSHDSTEVEIRDYIHHERYHQETLMIACRHNRLEVVEYLIRQAEYDISDGRAINAAAAAGHAEVLQCLLRLGRYPVRQYGDVLLLSAAKSGHEAVIEVLAEAGAHFSDCDEGTMRKIIESAAINGHDAVIRTLSCSRVQALLARTDTIALQLAAGNGHVAATRALLESGVPVDKRNPRGQTALHVAAESGHSAVAETLFEHGADPFLIANHETPIHLAAKAGHINVLEFFNRRAGLDSTRDLSLYNPRRTALHSAAAGCHGYVIFVIRWLVENGADVNSIDHKNDTPLNVAIRQGNETAVRVFLELGATVVGKSASTRGIAAHNYTLSSAAKGLNLFILRMVLENVERDRQVSYQTKRQLIIAALPSARALGSDEAAKLLEQALDRLSVGFLKE